MSAKDAGVDALMVLCSSGEMCVGSDETSVIAILCAEEEVRGQVCRVLKAD